MEGLLTYTFTHHIPHPRADELVAAEIGYQIQESGAAITGAIWQGTDLVRELSPGLLGRLEDEALAHWRDQQS